jgi:hypothetical protein
LLRSWHSPAPRLSSLDHFSPSVAWPR